MEAIRSEQRQLDRDIAAASKQREKMEEELWQHETTVSKTREALDKVVNEFNQHIQSLAVSQTERNQCVRKREGEKVWEEDEKKKSYE